MDTYREVTHQSFGSNLLESIKGVLVGILMFLGSFALIYWNEGRTDMSKVARKSVEIAPGGGNRAAGEGKLVSVSGPISADGNLGDPGYVRADSRVMLRRTVEMWAWTEKKTEKTEKKTGGGSDTITTYTYELAWTSKPDSSKFKQQSGHTNPPLKLTSQDFFARNASLGPYSFDPAAIGLPAPTPVTLGKSTADGALPVDNGFLFDGVGSVKGPRLGDLRISYAEVDAGRQVTAFGQASGATLVPHLHKGKERLFRVLDGTRDQAIKAMKTEHTRITWLLRVLAFFLMWLGMALVLGPIHAILDIIPFVGKASRAVVFFALFPVALVLTAVTVVISMIAHSPIALAVTAVAIVGVVLLVTKLKAKKREQAMGQAA